MNGLDTISCFLTKDLTASSKSTNRLFQLFFQAKAVCVGMSSHHACIQAQHWRPQNWHEPAIAISCTGRQNLLKLCGDQRSCTVESRSTRAASGVMPSRHGAKARFQIFQNESKWPGVDYEWHPRDAASLDPRLMEVYLRALRTGHQPTRIKEIINSKIAVELVGTDAMINSCIPLIPNH